MNDGEEQGTAEDDGLGTPVLGESSGEILEPMLSDQQETSRGMETSEASSLSSGLSTNCMP